MKTEYIINKKIAKAKKLLQEAEQLRRKIRKEKGDSQICKCGHRHDEHGISTSINYTAGFCKKCEYRHFLHKAVIAKYREHNTDSEDCWCEPRIEILKNGNKVIIHRVKYGSGDKLK